MSRCVLGMDVSKKDISLALLKNNRFFEKTIPNSPSGFKEILNFLQKNVHVIYYFSISLFVNKNLDDSDNKLRTIFYSNPKRTTFLYENLYFIKVILKIWKHAYGILSSVNLGENSFLNTTCGGSPPASDAFPGIFLRKTTGSDYLIFFAIFHKIIG